MLSVVHTRFDFLDGTYTVTIDVCYLELVSNSSVTKKQQPKTEMM